MQMRLPTQHKDEPNTSFIEYVIDDVCQEFDFEEAALLFHENGWWWSANDRSPTELELEVQARQLLRNVLKKNGQYSTTGRLLVVKTTDFIILTVSP